MLFNNDKDSWYLFITYYAFYNVTWSHSKENSKTKEKKTCKTSYVRYSFQRYFKWYHEKVRLTLMLMMLKCRTNDWDWKVVNSQHIIVSVYRMLWVFLQCEFLSFSALQYIQVLTSENTTVVSGGNVVSMLNRRHFLPRMHGFDGRRY